MRLNRAQEWRERMKICHITNVHGPFDGRIFHKMACSAAEYGHNVTLIAPHDKQEIRKGVRIIPIKKSTHRIKRIVETYRIFRIAAQVDADIYHFHDVELIPVMRWLKKKTGKGVIYDIHEYNREAILSKRWIPKIFRRILSEIVWKIEKRVCRSFDCTISATEELAQIFQKYSRKNECIWNYDFRRGIDLSEDKVRKDIDLIHVGTLTRERLSFFFKIIQELNHRGLYYTWYFIGVRRALFEKLRYQLDERSMQCIKFIERVPFEAVAGYYKRAKIGINYHKINRQLAVAMPLKIFEYMKHGLTVITSDLPPIHRFMKNNVNGIMIRNNTVEEFCDAICRAMEQNNFRLVSKTNKYNILIHFNWETEAVKLMKIYEEVYETLHEEKQSLTVKDIGQPDSCENQVEIESIL